MLGCKPLSDEEISLMMNSFDSLRDKCLFLLGLKTGFRISELLSVKRSDCIQYGKVKPFITVEKRNTKGKTASRSIPLNSEAQEALKQYIQTLPSAQKYLFVSQKGNKLSRIQAWRVIRNAAIKNKLEGKIATHSMRKSYAQRIYEKLGKDIVKTQRAMGHKSINSTVSYISFNEDEIIKAILEL